MNGKIKSRWVIKPLVILILLGTCIFSTASTSGTMAAGIHPVVLVHGLESSAERWLEPGTIYHALEAYGYDMSFVKRFSYPNGLDGHEDGTASIYPTAEKLAAEVAELSQASQLAGGSGEVDVVMHSLGGLITRQYLSQHVSDHKIGKFIDIGTPHSGSAFIAFYNLSAEEISYELSGKTVLSWVSKGL